MWYIKQNCVHSPCLESSFVMQHVRAGFFLFCFVYFPLPPSHMGIWMFLPAILHPPTPPPLFIQASIQTVLPCISYLYFPNPPLCYTLPDSRFCSANHTYYITISFDHFQNVIVGEWKAQGPLSELLAFICGIIKMLHEVMCGFSLGFASPPPS